MALDDELKAAAPASSAQAPPDEPTFWRVRAAPDDSAEAEPPESPDWRQRYEQVFEAGLSVEWKIRERKFWLVHQIESGSEDFVDAGSVFGVYPGAGDEQVLRSLRVSAEVTRERLQLEPDIKFKAIEMDPCAPETQPPWWGHGGKGPIPAAERRAAAKGTQPWYWSFEGPVRAANEDASTVVELAKRIGSGPVERADETSADKVVGDAAAFDAAVRRFFGDGSSADKAVGDAAAFDAAVRCFFGDESSGDKAVGDDGAAGEVSEEETGDEHPEITRGGEEPSLFRESLFRGIAKTLCPFCNGAVLYDPGGTMKAPLTCKRCSRKFLRPHDGDILPTTDIDLAQLAELGSEIAPSREPAEASLKPKPEPELPRCEPRLARCKQCGHVFLKGVMRDSPIQCELCGANVAWQFAVPIGSYEPDAGSNRPKLHVDQLRLFTGRSFEQFLRMLFQNMGFSVEETPATADQGADLILTDPSCRRTAIQAKRYNQDVGNAAVQEILGGMAYWECNSGVVVSASGFTKAARDLASKAHTVILWDKPVLEVLIDRYMSQVVVFVAEKQLALGVPGA